MKNTILSILLALGSAMAVHAADVKQSGDVVIIRPDGGEAHIIALQVINDNIVRVRATSRDMLPKKQESLIVVPQTGKARYSVSETPTAVEISTANLRAIVSKNDGKVVFADRDGKMILGEAAEGKRFWEYRVPDREIGVDVAKVSEQQRRGLTWQMVFDSPDDEAFYGLGQHQSEELNMKGKNEDLFQYNTKVSVPFVISNRNYGLLWDSYSYCRFGMPCDYLQLGAAFRLYDRNGHEGQLTGTYTDKQGRQIVRGEDSIYYEYACPTGSEIAAKVDKGGTRNLPEHFNLEGAHVVYEGFIEAPQDCDYQFISYYAGYFKVYIGGQEVVAERWRTSWNPNTYKFSCHLKKGKKTQLRIEWQPDGGESYCGLRVAMPRSEEEWGQLSVWSEMAQDMDYYFILGHDMDEVISGYRTLTGKAPVYPKWVMGFWQSRERYKTQDEVLSTLGEFRKRQIPIDNIVQDWNYWPEDQWGSHQFESARFPDPQLMLDSVHGMHGRFMISVWPKFYVNTAHYRALDEKGWMYHQSPVDDIHDWVGPGYKNSFYDAYSAGARKLFWQQMDDSLYTKYRHGIDAWWMDASEPNVRDCTPMWYRKALSGPTAMGTSTEYFNAYSIVNADAIYNGQRSVFKKKKGEPRVFLLTRSGFAGLQRYGTATWSGDIGTRWEDMRAQMTAGMNYSLSGLPFWGMDQGGFCVERRYMEAQNIYSQTGVENEDMKEWRELQARWNQFGCFVPLYRAHGQWPLREVWNIAPDSHPAYQSIVWYHQFRYRLMPYLYSMAGWVHLKDYTMMRALVMDFNGDSEVLDIKDQWMFGPSLMACPVSHYKARNRSVYFPRQRGWYDLYSGEYIDGGQRLIVDAPYERIPVYVPEGSIIPFGPAMQWSDEKPAELIDLYVYGGRDASFLLYEDEGTNYNYEKGKSSTISISYDDASKILTVGARQGSFDGMLTKRTFNVVLVDKANPCPLLFDARNSVKVEYDGRETKVNLAK